MTIPELRFKADDGSEFPDWEGKKLGDNVKFINGRAYSQDELLSVGKYQVLRVGNLFTNDTYYYSDMELEPDKYIEDGDLIYAWSATFGPRIYIGNKCIYHYHIWKLKFDENIVSKTFLNYILERDVEKIMSQRTGGTMVHITKSAMENRELFFPSLPEQKKIASFLSTIDDIIQSTESELTVWQERKKGVMQKIFSREVRFKADDGSEFPEWEEKKIGEICVINPKTEEVEDEFLYMDLGSVDHGDWEEPEVMIKSKAPSRAQRVARVGDVFFQSVRPYNQGHFHYSEKKDKQVVASTGYIQIRMKNCDSGFIYQILYDAHFNQEVSIRCTGSNYPAINADDFSEIVIAYPCVEEQRKIAECLSSLDDAINQIQAELSAWKEFKKGLLQQMFV